MKKLVGRRWWSMLLLIVAAIVAFKLINSVDVVWGWALRLVDILSPFIGGFVLAFLLYRPCCAVEQLFAKRRLWIFRRPAHAWSLVVVYLVLFATLALAIWGVVPLVAEGVTGLVKALPGYYEAALSFLEQHKDADNLFSMLNAQELVKSVYTFIRERLTVENLLNYASGLVSITSSFADVVIAFIISIYMLAGHESLFCNLRRLVGAFLPDRAMRLGTHYLRKAYDIFSRYMYSMLLDAFCICLVMIPGMYISGIPYPLAFAVLVGVANLIPYFGAIVSGALCVLVLLLSGQWGMALFLGVYVLVAQQLDSNLLQPRLYSQSVGIKPLYVLLAITVGGGLGGFVGMLIGVPVTAVLKILVSDVITHRNSVKQSAAAACAAEDELL